MGDQHSGLDKLSAVATETKYVSEKKNIIA